MSVKIGRLARQNTIGDTYFRFSRDSEKSQPGNKANACRLIVQLEAGSESTTREI